MKFYTHTSKQPFIKILISSLPPIIFLDFAVTSVHSAQSPVLPISQSCLQGTGRKMAAFSLMYHFLGRSQNLELVPRALGKLKTGELDGVSCWKERRKKSPFRAFVIPVSSSRRVICTDTSLSSPSCPHLFVPKPAGPGCRNWALLNGFQPQMAASLSCDVQLQWNRNLSLPYTKTMKEFLQAPHEFSFRSEVQFLLAHGLDS